MAISDKTRKALWGLAGGRCSRCGVLVVHESTDSDPASVFGEEAHIVAQSPGGPRAGYIADVDGYDNLILLCSNDHKRIDDQPEHFTVERLKKIKLAHETSVRAQCEVRAEGEPVPAPAATAPALGLVFTVHMSQEALFYCALFLVVVAFLALLYVASRNTRIA